MAWFAYIWTARAVEKCAQHGVSPEDFEFVLSNSRNRHKTHVVKGEQHWATEGPAEDGRWLKCVYITIDETTLFPVTAYEPTEI